MRLSIAKALVLSFLLHYAFVLVFLHFDSEYSIEKSLPVLNLQLLGSNDGTHSDESALTGQQEDMGAKAGSIVAAQNVLEAADRPVIELSERVAEEPRSGSRQQPRTPANPVTSEEEPVAIHALADAPTEESEPAPMQAVAVVTAAQSAWSRPTGELRATVRVPEKVPVSDPDRAMLERKFRQWGEDFHELAEETTRLDWDHNGQAYTASFRRLPPRGDMNLGHVVVEVSKEEGGTRFTTQMRMKNLSFSNFSQFIDRWNPDVEIHDDESDGRFHSNSEVRLSYSQRTWPVFFGKVTTSHRHINSSGSVGNVRRSQIFLGGLETGVKRIEMPKHYSPFPGEAAIKNAQARVFESDARITFYPDGTYEWQYIGSREPGERVALDAEGTLLVGARKASLHVKGVLDGRALVYSPDTIVIEGDLVYAEPPDSASGSDDYLGVVTDHSIEIAGPKVTGPGDLLINAAMYARRRFVVRRYMSENDGTLSIHGSLAAGSMSATEPRYATRIRFDRRLKDFRPPRFPLTNRYETVAWDGQWEAR